MIVAFEPYKAVWVVKDVRYDLSDPSQLRGLQDPGNTAASVAAAI